LNVVPARRSSTSAEWTYVLVTIAAFVFTPELRRLVDWRGNFDPLNVFVVIPLLMLCPVAVFAFRRRSRLRSRAFWFVMLAWLGGFLYATFIGAAHGSIVQAFYAIGQFCLPATVGVWLMTCDETMEVAHARLARALMIFGAVAAGYGIFQYVVAPPWDTAWMQNVGAESFGTPERFGIRVFGVLNGPGVFGLFLGTVIVFNLPYLRVRNRFNMVALLFMIVGLMLSLVRTAWLAVFIGIAIFVWLSPRRLQAVLGVGAVALICGTAVFGVLVASPDAGVGAKLAARFTTLSNIGEDPSTIERENTSQIALQQALDEPVGAGLGLTGGGAKLVTSDSQAFNRTPPGAIDNGFITRFFEMGVPGFAAFLVACCGSIAVLCVTYIRFARSRDRSGMTVAASCIAAQIIIFAVNASGDDQQALLGVLFFAALALPLMQPNQRRAEDPARSRSLPPRRPAGVRRSAFQ
jgi:putative inorganic carbon (HCO3(-)) transporter